MANLFPAATAILILLTVSLTAAPRTPLGSISGTVYDQQQGVIPGATVTVTNQETNVTRQVKSDKRGEYAVSDLPPGVYTITGALEGFVTLKQPGITVRDTSAMVFDLHLKVRVWICVG